MASIQQPLRRDPFQSQPSTYHSNVPKSIPILPSASLQPRGDPMDVNQSQSGPMGPPSTSPNGDKSREQQQDHDDANGSNLQPTGAAAAAQQPKVVQTAFIHKLYNMLEDQNIQHLISWSSTNESFVMSPSSEFSKVLAQYFKHTNISSFVRQLNMYGFHKVSDVFHTGSPDSPLWEFKHGQGSFKRGDLVGLREIKRRASRHALIHRDSFSTAPKMPTPQPPGTPMEPMPDPVEARLNMLEWNFQDMHARLSRSEEAYSNLTSKHHTILDGLLKCHQWTNDISSHLLTVVPDPDNPVHRDVYAMRNEIRHHIDTLRTLDEPQPQQESLFGHRQSFFQPNNHHAPMEPAMPMSPRQRPFDESRRPSLQGPSLQGPPRPVGVRAPVPQYLQASPRRYGSIGTGNNGAYSPTSSRPPYSNAPNPGLQPQPQQPQPAQQPHPLATMTSPPSSLPRRHTSADIRLQGWEGGQPPPSGHYGQGTSPYQSGQSSGAWPSSPRAPANPGDQQIRDTLAQYELPRVSHPGSRPHSPGPHESGQPSFNHSFAAPSYANSNDAGWQLPGARFPFKGLTEGSRRSSMASNVHSLLNPADTAEREGEDEGAPDDRKRKRLL
ncbi:Putative Heat shock factor (HSF)-type, DNA-binding, Heat shock transcription factor family [Septoria linicola]|uniref:Heat shock factor (HSF)-type, DNA-binding, Heat shock transcription factor family n=1 Tax=Septoria linicola TaxID=215465 RepID=A0A9Q9B0V3_9PEZI|nr:putative Heat shock factor (HSF)-type, DNA-binding, Heat shock transcription factor family [Septoria linicola]USW55407.1 Putative Heat shock factor (HSF)-type, DNA-binding, Heat shock transcription factor family [Septoria linicola]